MRRNTVFIRLVRENTLGRKENREKEKQTNRELVYGKK